MADEKRIRGMRSRLMAHGDERFSMLLRKIFIKALGYGDDALDRPLIGITTPRTGADYRAGESARTKSHSYDLDVLTRCPFTAVAPV
jgi:hypothetical protein